MVVKVRMEHCDGLTSLAVIADVIEATLLPATRFAAEKAEMTLMVTKTTKLAEAQKNMREKVIEASRAASARGKPHCFLRP